MRLLSLQIAVLLTGCIGVGADFDKATFAGRMKLQKGERFSAQAVIPQGEAQLIIALPGYMCRRKSNALLHLSLTGEEIQGTSATVALDQLVWGHSLGSCDAFGYLARSEAHRKSAHLLV